MLHACILFLLVICALDFNVFTFAFCISLHIYMNTLNRNCFDIEIVYRNCCNQLSNYLDGRNPGALVEVVQGDNDVRSRQHCSIRPIPIYQSFRL